MLILGAAPALADVMPTPGGGPAFGQHVSTMAPGNGGMSGVSFGECVSSMATGTCICICPCPMPSL
jgi:hypothetical protein